MKWRMRSALQVALLLTGLLVTSVAFAGGVGQPAGGASTGLEPIPLIIFGPRVVPGATACVGGREHNGSACPYSPSQLETAYDMKPLYAKGLDGRGETIAIVDAFGSPTIGHDLATFDKTFGLPAPAALNILRPAGKVPKFNGKNGSMVAWAGETSLDVEYAHAMAPGASILLVETPVSETIGTAGFPQIVKAENYVVNHHLAAVISQSFAAGEATFSPLKAIEKLRTAYVNAEQHDVTIVGAAGDNGPTQASNASNTTFFTKRVVAWPASDPLITAVGGSHLDLGAGGARLAPDKAWHDAGTSPAAGGGGRSVLFPRPAYQNGVAGVTGNHRGVPDVSMDADVFGGATVYMSFPGISPGFYDIGGTSEATPLFAGIVAVADQAAGHWLGLINPMLYALEGKAGAGIVDVAAGNTTVTFRQGGGTVTVKGFAATKGYDLATGLGTVDGEELVTALAAT